MRRRGCASAGGEREKGERKKTRARFFSLALLASLSLTPHDTHLGDELYDLQVVQVRQEPGGLGEQEVSRQDGDPGAVQRVDGGLACGEWREGNEREGGRRARLREEDEKKRGGRGAGPCCPPILPPSPPLFSPSLLTSPRVAVVQDIVVDEGGSVDHLRDLGQAAVLVRDVAVWRGVGESVQ